MRILVYEFVTGGGLAGQVVADSLAREGAAMRAALVEDLAGNAENQIVTTSDSRFGYAAPSGVEVVGIAPGDPGQAALDDLIASADAVWFVAPETDRCLERLAARAEGQKKTLLGPGANAIRRASDKACYAASLVAHGIAVPATRVVCARADWNQWTAAAADLGYPVVVKPRRGAGCDGVCIAREARQLRGALDLTLRSSGPNAVVLQRFVRGVPASVSILGDGQRAMALSVNAQSVRAAQPFEYEGGAVPLSHALAANAADVAVRTCEALGGLRGYVGVDLILTESEAVVIEVNPRLTTAYLGVRSAIDANVAELAVAACMGSLPAPVPLRRRVTFTAGGRIVSSVPIPPSRNAPSAIVRS